MRTRGNRTPDSPPALISICTRPFSKRSWVHSGSPIHRGGRECALGRGKSCEPGSSRYRDSLNGRQTVGAAVTRMRNRNYQADSPGLVSPQARLTLTSTDVGAGRVATKLCGASLRAALPAVAMRRRTQAQQVGQSDCMHFPCNGLIGWNR